jgi:hypothetical protein
VSKALKRVLIADLEMKKELYVMKKLDVLHTQTAHTSVFRMPGIVSKEE